MSIYRDAYNALCEIANIYSDYHYTSDEVLEKIETILKAYEYID